MRYFFSNPSIVEWGALGTRLIENNVSSRAFLSFLIIGFFLIAILSYLLGSINTAVLLSKKIYGYDVRDYGSGNAGMTNMFRTFGKKAGLLTLAGDAVKALLAISIAFFILGGPGQYIAGFFCILGHVFPVYYRFKGGKGVVVGAITVLLIDPLVFLVLLLIFSLMFAATQIISASSITAAFFYPLVVYAFNIRHPSTVYLLFSLFIAFFIIAMHRENIHRLLNKTEKKFTFGKGKKK